MTKTQHDSETLAEGRQVFTACAFLYKIEDGQPHVFLAKRAATKKFLPGVYELPGGHVDYGEELQDGLRREIREEMGVEVVVGDVVDVFTYTNNIKKCQSVEVVYFATLTSPESAITLHHEDHSEYVWVAEADVLPLIRSTGKDETDKELQVIQKGFKLL